MSPEAERRAVPCWHIDAFASRPFAGNPAAVVALDAWVDDSTLQAIAAETNLPATVFVVRGADGVAGWHLRAFSPAREIRLCGHATLASGHALLTRGGGDGVTFRTQAVGEIEVRRLGQDGYELALPAIPTAPGEWPEAAALLGAEPIAVWRSADRYNVFLFDGEDTVRALRPDLPGLAALGDDQFICTAPGHTADVVSRVFVPGAGAAEDSVTGSAHAVLAPIWAERLGRDRFTAHQASARGGDLVCRLAKDTGGDRVWLGGQCVTVLEGTFHLP